MIQAATSVKEWPRSSLTTCLPARLLLRRRARNPKIFYIAPACFRSCGFVRHGEVSEWLKEHAWKACVGETLPWVRIPPSPPLSQAKFDLRRSCRQKSPNWPGIHVGRPRTGLRRIVDQAAHRQLCLIFLQSAPPQSGFDKPSRPANAVASPKHAFLSAL